MSSVGHLKAASKQLRGDTVSAKDTIHSQVAHRQTRPLGANIVNYIPAHDRPPDGK